MPPSSPTRPSAAIPDVLPGARPVRAPRTLTKTCKTWQAEAAMRMLMNNLDPTVAERPDALVVYGGRGQAARSWEAFDAIIAALQRLEPDQTLLVQSGKPVGIIRTHTDAPRVLLANSNLVPHWATQEHFDDLARKGLIMYGQMTAGSWIYIGTQGILQGTFETFAECGKQQFAASSTNGTANGKSTTTNTGTLKGKLCITAGCGGMGGAQPLAITMCEGTCLIADVDRTRLERRLRDRYLDEVITAPTPHATAHLDAAIDRAVALAKQGKALSIGVEANAVDLLERLLARNITPDVLTDQTSAHDPLVGYVPVGMTMAEADHLRVSDPTLYIDRSTASMERHVRAMVELQKRGSITFDYGNNIRQQAFNRGFKDAFAFPGFVPAYIRPQFCLGRGPFRWCALSGDPRDIFITDHAILKLFPLHPTTTPSTGGTGVSPVQSPAHSTGGTGVSPVRSPAHNTGGTGVPPVRSQAEQAYIERLHKWILSCHANPEALLAGDFNNCKPRFEFQGLPARICWLGLGQRDKAGLLFNDLVRKGSSHGGVSAPIVIGRDHLDCGSVASPNRETEAMKDGSDAISDWAVLSAMVNIASGASWVSFHHGGGVGIGYSQHCGQVIVADGTPEAAKRLERVLTNDPMMGIFRHADAGYEEAITCGQRLHVDIPR